MDNGSNSIDSIKMKIKTRKIKVVKQLDEKTYSDTMYAWLYETTGTVYDFNTYYPIGKIGKDSNNNLKKLDKDIYIIEQVINIPVFKLYD